MRERVHFEELPQNLKEILEDLESLGLVKTFDYNFLVTSKCIQLLFEKTANFVAYLKMRNKVEEFIKDLVEDPEGALTTYVVSVLLAKVAEKRRELGIKDYLEFTKEYVNSMGAFANTVVRAGGEVTVMLGAKLLAESLAALSSE